MKPKTDDISASKKALFTIVAFALPILLLIVLELALHLVNYGGTLDLFIQQTQGEHTEYVLNKNFTKRYFFHKGIKTPVPLSQTFSVEKNDSTFRVFCLGASTTQGFPYQPNGSYPAILQHILDDLFQTKNIEVINCGITAITSHSVLDMQRDILKKYEPDLIIVYSGHNEFYGVFGQASTLSLFKNRVILKSFLALQRSKVVLLARNTANQLFGKRIERDTDQSQTLMRLMATDIGIKFSSTLVRKAEKDYQKNIADMCRLAQRHDTPILLCTLADNQRDLPPFSSQQSDMSAGDSTRWRSHMHNGQILQDSQQFTDALAEYHNALSIDSTCALTHFRIGHCYAAMDKSDPAQKHFTLAKDFDTIRFRAPSSFNMILRNTAKKYNVPLIDIEEAFREQSPGGVPGHNLLFEHVHPNVNGYLLIARTIAQAIDESDILPDQRYWSAIKSDSAYLAQTAMTTLDHEVVNYTLYRLRTQWPFPAPDTLPAYSRIGTPRTQALAVECVDGDHNSLVQLHLDYGHELHQNNQLDEALAEYKAALAIQPLEVTFNRIGRIYLRKTETAIRDDKDYQAALAYFNNGLYYFKTGLKRWPDAIELHFNLGLLYFLRQNETEAAITHFRAVLELEPNHKNAHRQLVDSYIRRQDYGKAKSLLQQAVARFPNEARFCTDLGLVFLQEQNAKEARIWLNKAIHISDDPKAQYFLNQLDAQSSRK